MNPSTRSLFRLFAIAAAVSCAGCGPFGYLKKTAKDASMAVADAERAEAEQYAPYEYWGAKAYLDQSKVMMGYSEYERSFDYGDRASQLAAEAKAKAERREAGVERVVDPDKAPEAMPEGEEAPAENGAAGEASGEGKAKAKDGEAKAGGKAGGKVGGGSK